VRLLGVPLEGCGPGLLAVDQRVRLSVSPRSQLTTALTERLPRRLSTRTRIRPRAGRLLGWMRACSFTKSDRHRLPGPSAGPAHLDRVRARPRALDRAVPADLQSTILSIVHPQVSGSREREHRRAPIDRGLADRRGRVADRGLAAGLPVDAGGRPIGSLGSYGRAARVLRSWAIRTVSCWQSPTPLQSRRASSASIRGQVRRQSAGVLPRLMRVRGLEPKPAGAPARQPSERAFHTSHLGP
jgi:hypothetical protein